MYFYNQYQLLWTDTSCYIPRPIQLSGVDSQYLVMILVHLILDQIRLHVSLGIVCFNYTVSFLATAIIHLHIEVFLNSSYWSSRSCLRFIALFSRSVLSARNLWRRVISIQYIHICTPSFPAICPSLKGPRLPPSTVLWIATFIVVLSSFT